jgi:hypothetical protein
MAGLEFSPQVLSTSRDALSLLGVGLIHSLPNHTSVPGVLPETVPAHASQLATVSAVSCSTSAGKYSAAVLQLAKCSIRTAPVNWRLHSCTPFGRAYNIMPPLRLPRLDGIQCHCSFQDPTSTSFFVFQLQHPSYSATLKCHESRSNPSSPSSLHGHWFWHNMSTCEHQEKTSPDELSPAPARHLSLQLLPQRQAVV